MNILHDVNLADYSTMGLGGTASHLVRVENRMELLEALSWAQQQNQQIIMIGGGSNIVWRDEGFDGLIIVNAIERYETFTEDEENVYITAGSGENWDTVVERTAQAGLTGIEALSLIPGSTGATLVQNIGAYGQDISQTLVTAEVYDTQANDFTTMRAEDCGFGYRTSRFKTTDRGRYLITAITLHLRRGSIQPPFYPLLQKYFDDHNITDYSPQNVRDAVVAIRSNRLPDPASIHNNGSFFANPIVDHELVVNLRALYPEIPFWSLESGKAKVPAAWLIEHAGFKDYHDESTGMATWQYQPLVLVNEHAKQTKDLLDFKQKIVTGVENKFGITLEQEPELFPLP